MNDVAAAHKQWFGHPRGLSTLFFTELWERFSYYGMRGILILFMVNQTTGGLGFGDETAAAIYGLYTAGVYLLALPGGWIADRLIGQRRAVLFGGAIIALGHFTLAISSVPTFFLGLCLILIGTGLLKPNVSAIVGDLYPEKGAYRDAGFAIYYTGINLGAFLGPLACGWLGEHFNWHFGFSAAGVGMVLGLIQYVFGGQYLGRAGELRDVDLGQRRADWRKFFAGLGVFAALTALIAFLQNSGTLQLSLQRVAEGTGVFIVGLALVYFLYLLLFGGLDHGEKKRVVVIFILFFASAIFWSGFEQAGSSMNLFADRDTDRVLFGWEAPTSWLQSVNPLFIITLSPIFGWLWLWLGSRQPSIPLKFTAALMFMATGFLVMAWGASYTQNGTSKVGPIWLIVTYFLHTSGELCLSPVGLSSVTKLSPRHLVGQMMGVWFMGSALGNLIAGLAAGKLASLSSQGLFMKVALWGGAAGVLMLLLTPWIQRKLIGNYLDQPDRAA